MPKEALSLDLDGVVVGRIPFQWAAAGRLFRRPPIDFSPPPLTKLNRGILYEEPNLKTRLNLFRHSIAPVTRQARQVIPQLSQFADVYANSGRANTSIWIEHAISAFKKAGIGEYIKGYYFKPQETRTVVSKMAAIADLRKEYDKVTHVDDNPKDALPIARAFPDVNVVILQDLSTGLLVSMKELQQYPNVRRIVHLRELLPQS